METANVHKPIFTNRELISLSVPIIIESVLAIITGMADSAMVSSAGEAATGGVSLVDQVMILLVLLFSSIASGGVVVTSQYLGNHDFVKAKSSAKQLLYASTTIALLTVACFIGIIPQILRLIFGDLEQAVFENAKVYFFYVLIGLPFYAIATACTSLLRTMSHSKLALMLAFGANLLNIAGNAILIHGFEMGAAGAAIATTFSRIVWAAVGLVILHNRGLPVYFEQLLKFRIDFDVLRRVLKIGIANGIENGLFQVGKLLVASLVSTFGTIYIAANAVTNTVCNIGWTIVGSISTILLTVVGRCIGANEPEQAKVYTKKFINIGHCMVFIVFGVTFLLRNQFVRLFDFGPEALEVAAQYTGIVSVLTITSFYGLTFAPLAAFRAAGDIKYAMVLTIASMFICRVGLAYLLNSLFPLGLLSVWLGMFTDWAVHSICNTIHLRKGKWLTKRLI